MDGAFTVEDFDVLAQDVMAAWASALDRDWSVPAGPLEWSCLQTADHLVDCVFSYAFFLASRKIDGYPNFGELHALPGATPTDVLEGLRAVTTLLVSVIVTAPADAVATIMRFPQIQLGAPQDFAARGALELVLHGHDVCQGLGLSFEPPVDICRRLVVATEAYPGHHEYPDDLSPWTSLLVRSGRPVTSLQGQ